MGFQSARDSHPSLLPRGSATTSWRHEFTGTHEIYAPLWLPHTIANEDAITFTSVHVGVSEVLVHNICKIMDCGVMLVVGHIVSCDGMNNRGMKKAASSLAG